MSQTKAMSMSEYIQGAVAAAAKPFLLRPATKDLVDKMREEVERAVLGSMPAAKVLGVEMRPDGTLTANIEVPAHLVCGACGVWVGNQHADSCLAELAEAANVAAGLPPSSAPHYVLNYTIEDASKTE